MANVQKEFIRDAIAEGQIGLALGDHGYHFVSKAGEETLEEEINRATTTLERFFEETGTAMPEDL